MGATCSSLDASKVVSRGAADRLRRSVGLDKKRAQRTGDVAYDTDDEDDEAADYSKLPKYARDLIVKVEKEERAIESEDIDPILLTKIRPESLRYEFVRQNGTKQLFRAESLIDYMLATQRFHDPETRIEFTDDQLKELDALGSALGKESVYAAKTDGAWKRRQLDDDADAFAGLERFCGEHVYQMLKAIERRRRDEIQNGEMSLLVKCFPFYRHYIGMMFNLDREATVVAIDQYKKFLVGPPNHPTHDRSKHLLKYCLDFIDEVTRDLWNTEAQS